MSNEIVQESLSEGSDENSSILSESSIMEDERILSETENLSLQLGSLQLVQCSDTNIASKIIINKGPTTIIHSAMNQRLAPHVFLPWKSDNHRDDQPRNANNGEMFIPTQETTLRILSRSEWYAHPPSNELDKLDLPVEMIIIAHTATVGSMNTVIILQKNSATFIF